MIVGVLVIIKIIMIVVKIIDMVLEMWMFDCDSFLCRCRILRICRMIIGISDIKNGMFVINIFIIIFWDLDINFFLKRYRWKVYSVVIMVDVIYILMDMYSILVYENVRL